MRSCPIPPAPTKPITDALRTLISNRSNAYDAKLETTCGSTAKRMDATQLAPVAVAPSTGFMSMFSTTSANSLPSAPNEWIRSEEHTSELQSLRHIVCRLLLEKKKEKYW